MEFKGNLSTDLGLEYHSFSEVERDGNLVTRYLLSSPVDSETLEKLSEYDNVKLIKNGASHRYAPEIKYDVLYVSAPSVGDEESLPSEYLESTEELSEDEVLSKLDLEVSGVDNEQEDLAKYAAITSAMNELNSLILLYKTLSAQYPEYSQLFDDLVSESEVQLGKLTSTINNPETSKNMITGVEEGNNLIDN